MEQTDASFSSCKCPGLTPFLGSWATGTREIRDLGLAFPTPVSSPVLGECAVRGRNWTGVGVEVEMLRPALGPLSRADGQSFRGRRTPSSATSCLSALGKPLRVSEPSVPHLCDEDKHPNFAE